MRGRRRSHEPQRCQRGGLTLPTAVRVPGAVILLGKEQFLGLYLTGALTSSLASYLYKMFVFSPAVSLGAVSSGRDRCPNRGWKVLNESLMS